MGLIDGAGGAPSVRIGPTPSPAPIRLLVPLLPSGDPERQDAHCAPRSYGDGGGSPDGGGVRRGFSVGDGSGVGVGEGVGSAVALGVAEGSSEGDGLGVGVGVGLGSGVALGVAEGSTDTEGCGEAVGAGVITGAGVTASTGVGRGVAVVEGSAVWAAGTEIVGVATGGIVTRGPTIDGKLETTCDAANTNALPSRATDKIVTTSVPVVRIAPRRTWLRRSESQDRRACRCARSSSTASRMRSSRSCVGRGTGSDPSSPSTRVLLPISAAHAAQPLTCAARRVASAARRSSSRKRSMSWRARAQSKARTSCGFVTSHT